MILAYNILVTNKQRLNYIMNTQITDTVPSAVTKVAKVKKSDQAFQIFRFHLPKRDTMTPKQFRAGVVAEMKKKMGVTNAGTLGMYFSWADKYVTGRPKKQYNRVGGRSKTPKNAVNADGKTEQQAMSVAMDAWYKNTVQTSKARIAAKQKEIAQLPSQKAAKRAIEDNDKKVD